MANPITIKTTEIEELEEKLCEYCRCEGISMHCTPGGTPVFCEGTWCDEAYERYLEEIGYTQNRKTVITCQIIK